LIGREASEMSVSPAQNFSKPPPVPEEPTVIFTFGLSSLNSSAAACAYGRTVLEPSREILPLRSPPPPPPPLSSLPHAATPMASTPAAARTVIFPVRRTNAPLVVSLMARDSQAVSRSLLPACGRDVKSM
jgi:hypothetical protein